MMYFFLLLLTLQSHTVHAGPFKFLMMMQEEHGPAAAPTESFPSAKTAQDLAKELEAMQNDRDVAIREKDRILAEFENYKADTNMRLDQLTKNSEVNARVASVQQDFTERIARMQHQTQKDMATLKTTIDEKNAAIAKMENQYSIALANAEAKCAASTADKGSEALKLAQSQIKEFQQANTRLEAEKVTIQEMYTTLEGKWEKKLQETEADKQAYLDRSLAEEVQKKANEIEASWSVKVEQALKDKEAALLAIRQQFQKEHAAAMEAEKSIAASLRQDIQVFNEKSTKDAALIGSLQGKLREAQTQASFWEKTFNDRHFFNSTHAADKLESVRKEINSRAVPYVKKSKALYQEHLKEHVDKAKEFVRPHFENHVVPLVKKSKEVLTSAKDEIETQRAAAFDYSVNAYKGVCPEALRQLESVQEKAAFIAPAIEVLDQSCKKPETTVSNLFKTLFILFIIIFRRYTIMPVINVAVVVFMFFFDLCWNLSPFRLIFGPRTRKAKKKVVANGSHKMVSSNGISRKKIPSDPKIKK